MTECGRRPFDAQQLRELLCAGNPVARRDDRVIELNRHDDLSSFCARCAAVDLQRLPFDTPHRAPLEAKSSRSNRDQR
jgi:hypothetical protein